MSTSTGAGPGNVALLLRRFRERALLTQEELAARTGLGVRTIRRLESDAPRRPHSRSVRLIADALELTPGERAQLVAATAGTPLFSGPPRQLPTPPQAFTGRKAELAQLDRIEDISTVVITAIDGMAGIGKTALAVHAAHRLADHYPDGQLFVDLHGYSEGIAPLEPGEALDRMLRALGAAGEQIPADLDERAGLYRSQLADRQMLILLDNAATEAQVAPLLPGAAGCLVLITSRRRLAGLDQTHTISLDTMPTPDAVTLFGRIVGEQRLADQSPELVAEAVELCGRLPLAIRIAAAWLESHPRWSVAELVERMRDQHLQLVELEHGSRSVAAAIELSYQQLPTAQQHMYRLLALHPGPDLDAYVAAALADTTIAQARRLLDQLLYAHLLQEPAVGRYVFHDLVRAHAASTVARSTTEPDRRAALCHLLDYYRHTAAAAMDTAYPYERERRPQVGPAGTPRPDLPEPTQATSWLDTELPNLLAAARLAAAHGWPEHACHLPAILHRHLRARGRYRDAESLHQRALTTARIAGDRTSALHARLGLGHVRRLQGRYEQAMVDFEQALEIAQDTGNRTGEQQASTGLGHVHQQQGRLEEALDWYARALDLARATDNRTGEQEALIGMGGVHRLQGRYDQTLHHFKQALEIARATSNQVCEQDALTGLGWSHMQRKQLDQAADDFEQALGIALAANNRIGELNALTGIGFVRLRQGRDEHALGDLTQVLEIARTTNHRPGQMDALLGLGQIHLRQGRYEQAAIQFDHALELARGIGHRNWQFEAIHGLGQVDQATGHVRRALVHHHEALELATDLRQAPDQARAHDGLARAYYTIDDQDRASRHWQHALDILASLGVDDVEDGHTNAATIRAKLAKLDSAQLGHLRGGS
jgi:tetratricopeptide (TPR) repeat protein/transcriptional regulator with XRE-family HTH domain